MGTYVTIVIGVAAVLLGIYGIATTWPLVWLALKAFGLIVLVVGGISAIAVGVGELRDRDATK